MAFLIIQLMFFSVIAVTRFAKLASTRLLTALLALLPIISTTLLVFLIAATSLFLAMETTLTKLAMTVELIALLAQIVHGVHHVLITLVQI